MNFHAVSLALAGVESEPFGSVQEVCHWHKQRAMATGDEACWRKYYAC